MKFSELFQSYGSMQIPAFSLTVGGTALTTGPGARLLRAECSLTSRPEAGYLLLEAQLDPADAGGTAWLDALTPGASCAFSLGYGDQTKQVFLGELWDIRWEDPLHGGLMRVEAVFLDVRGRLTRSAHADAGSARTLSALISGIVEGLNCSSLGITGDVRGVPKAWDLPVSRRGGSDYDVLCRAAAFLSYEFYAWSDELYFGPARPESKEAVEFDGSDGLARIRRHGTLSGQCKTVTVAGADDTGAGFSYSETRQDGLVSVVTEEKRLLAPAARTMGQAQYLAESRMKEIQRRSGGLAGWSAGVPDLRPGRFVKLSGIGDRVNGTYYVHTVRHTLDETGFETYFESEA